MQMPTTSSSDIQTSNTQLSSAPMKNDGTNNKAVRLHIYNEIQTNNIQQHRSTNIYTRNKDKQDEKKADF